MLRTWDLSVEDTYLQQTTQVDDAEEFAHADISPDGQQVAYRWIDDKDTGWVRFVDTVTGEATPPDALPGVWSPLDLRHLASPGRAVRRILRAPECARARHRQRPRPRHGQAPPETRRLVDGDVSVTGVRRRGSQPACGRLRRHGPSSSTPRPFDPGAMAFDFRRALLRHPDRGREHRDGPRDLRRRASGTGG